METSIRNNAIEFYRFFFSMFICTLHFKEYYGNPYPFGGAYLAVEFFFLLSGFFLAQHVSTKKNISKLNVSTENEAFRYLCSRYKKLYPQYFLSLALLLIYRIMCTGYSFKEFLIHNLGEILMLQITGIGRYINDAMWFVSAMLVVSFFLYYFLLKYPAQLLYIWGPTLVAVLYSYFYQSNGSLAGIGLRTRSLIITDGFWRAVAGMTLGCLVYFVFTRMRSTLIKLPDILFSLFEIAALALFSVMFYRPGCTVKDFTLVLIMAVFMISVMSGKSFLSKLLNNKVSRSLGKISFAVYCNHWLFNLVIKQYFPGHPFYFVTLIYLFMVVLFSTMTTICVNKFQNRLDCWRF